MRVYSEEFWPGGEGFTEELRARCQVDLTSVKRGRGSSRCKGKVVRECGEAGVKAAREQ